MIALVTQNLKVAQLERQMRGGLAGLDVIHIHDGAACGSRPTALALGSIQLEGSHPQASPLKALQELWANHIKAWPIGSTIPYALDGWQQPGRVLDVVEVAHRPSSE